MAKAVLVAGDPRLTEVVRRILLVAGYEIEDISTPMLVPKAVDTGGVDLVVIVLSVAFAQEQVDATSQVAKKFPVLGIAPTADMDTDPIMLAGAREVIDASQRTWMATVEKALADLKT